MKLAGDVMKRFGVTGGWLVAVVLFICMVGIILRGSNLQIGNEESTVASTGASAGDDGNRYLRPDSSSAALVQLPMMRADGSHPIRLTRAILEQAWLNGKLEVSLPGGGRYPVVLKSERLDPGGQWTVTGSVQTTVGAQTMVLTFGPDAVFGVLPHPSGSLLHVTTTRGSTEIALAGGLLPPGTKSTLATIPDYLVPDPGNPRISNMPPATRLLDARPLKTSSLVEIVILGLYTDDLVDLRGSVSAAETETTNLFAIANQSHIDSGTRVRLTLAGLRRITIDPALNNHQALYAITDNNVPDIDLLQLRDDMAADLLALVRPYQDTHGTCGVAWLNGGGRVPQYISDHFGVSVSNVAPCGPYVLVHEIGHNIGSAHDRETQSINGYIDFGAYQYSFGYRQDGPPAFATIMAYSSGQPWIGYFSNPNSSACGARCGVEDRSDNVRSLNAIAPVIAAFRGPPGTLSIVDSEIYEPEPGTGDLLIFRVRLSGPAPAGGVRFDTVVSGGSAQAGVDYVAYPTTPGMIREGEREANVVIEVIGDSLVEPDETIHLQLTNVTGATVHKAEAIGRILNDDPRLTISGRITFDRTVPRPDSEFTMLVNGVSGSPTSTLVRLSPPHFTYELSVVKGASLHFSIDPPPPFAILPFTIDEVESSRVHDILLQKGMHVSGEVKLPAGQPGLTEPMALDIRASIDGNYQAIPSGFLEPPNFRYSHWVVPGAWLYMEVVPPAPYQRFFAVHNDVRSDIVQDIELSTLPALVIWGGGRITEGYPGLHGTLGFVIQLSAPAPAGGVQLRYRSIDGTATAGSDYTAIEGEIDIPEGGTIAYTDTLIWFGDDEVEGSEYFHVVVTDVVGANPVVTRIKVTLTETERYMSTPLPPIRRH